MIKNFLNISCCILLGCSLFFSCVAPTSPAPAPGAGPGPGSQSMTANVGGASWTAGSVSSSGGASGWVVFGTSSNHSIIELILPSTTSTKYDLGPTNTTTAGIIYSIGTTGYLSNSGSITVTNFAGGVITGKFDGYVKNPNLATDSVAITGGNFTAKLQ